MKSIFLISVLFLLFGCQESNNPSNGDRKLIDVDKCGYHISIDKYGLINRFHSNPDTVKLNSTSYLVVNLYTCEGEMDLKEFHLDSGLVLTGHYKAAEKLTKGVNTNYDASGEASSDTSFAYYPTKTGIWEYYNKSGKVVKTENFN